MHIQTINFEFNGFLGVMVAHRINREIFIFIRLGNAGADISSWSNEVIQAILNEENAWMIEKDVKKYMNEITAQSRPWIK